MWSCSHCGTNVADGRFCPFDGTALRLEIHGYAVEREVGRGLTGVVYAARRPDGACVAIKVLHRDWLCDDEMRERFVREADAAAAVRHPCVVAPSAAGMLEDGRPYLVMELVDGPSLDDVLALGPLAEPRALAIARDLASALAAVHAAGVVHRDVKPGNVRIGKDGRARLLDFGVALRPDGDDARLTGGGLAVGTPHYMAPEQCSGDVIDGRSDIYALGVVIYRMLTGRVPFEGSAVAVMLAHTSRAPEPPSAHVSVSAALDAVVMRCLAKRRGARLSADELCEELAAVAWGLDVDPRAATELAAEAETDPETESESDPVTVTESDPVTVTETESESESETETDPEPATETDTEWETASMFDGSLPRPRRRRRYVLASLALVAAAVAALAFTPLHHTFGLDSFAIGHAHAEPSSRPSLPVTPPPAEVVTEGRELMVASDDLVAIRVAVPRELSPRRSHELTVEVWDADGEPVDTTDLVVTFAGPRGAAIGLAADPTRTRGVYRVTARFSERGPWTMRVYAPVGDSVVQLELDVGATPSS